MTTGWIRLYTSDSQTERVKKSDGEQKQIAKAPGVGMCGLGSGAGWVRLSNLSLYDGLA